MAQVFADPDELERFAHSLNQFIDSLNDAALALGSRFKLFNDADALPLQEILDSIGKCRTALIVDGLDSEKSLYPTSAYKVPKPGEPSSPADLLKRIADEGPRKGTFVFAFIENWRRCAGPCKDLFALFELRVAFCMNEEDAGTLVSGVSAKFKGIEKPNRAVFVNRMTNEMTWFRPYIQKILNEKISSHLVWHHRLPRIFGI